MIIFGTKDWYKPSEAKGAFWHIPADFVLELERMRGERAALPIRWGGFCSVGCGGPSKWAEGSRAAPGGPSYRKVLNKAEREKNMLHCLSPFSQVCLRCEK